MRYAYAHRALAVLSAGIVVLALAACGSSSTTPRADTAAPAQWVTIAVQAVRNDAAANPPGLPPMVDGRIYAMAFVASHDALNAIDRRYAPFLTDTARQVPTRTRPSRRRSTR